jgi:hypothetical protein
MLSAPPVCISLMVPMLSLVAIMPSDLEATTRLVQTLLLTQHIGTTMVLAQSACSTFNPCDENIPCFLYDNNTFLTEKRWYPSAEPLADGTVVVIGGFTAGGYINRNYPNTDPTYEGGAADPTYEFYPAGPQPPQIMNFMVNTSGLNSYALTYLMPSGNMFVQANYSTGNVHLI